MKKLFTFLVGLCLYCLCSSGAFATLDDGLIGYWPLDGDALDYSGIGNHGTMLQGAGFVTNPTGDGLVLQNVVGDVNEGHVRVGLPSSYHPASGVVGFKGAGAFWVFFDDRESMRISEGWQGILGNPPGMLYVAREFSRNGIRTMARRVENAGSNKNVWPLTPIDSVSEQGVWYHVAWTFHSHNQGDEGHFRLYINGYLRAEYRNGVQTRPTSNFRIGAGQDAYGSNMKMAEVRLYDRILTAEEVFELAWQEGFHPLGHYPLWWELYGVIHSDAVPDDYAAVNQGQLKHVATQAAEYLDDALKVIGGSGVSVQSMVAAWGTPSPQADDYAAANLGQVKFVSARFYDRLNEVLFDQWPDVMSIDPATGYPWPPTGSDDYALANQGQLKFLFSWNPIAWLRRDSNNDGLPDWLQQYMLSLNPDGDVSPSGDFDGDGISNIDEYLSGELVADFYNGNAASFVIEVLDGPVVIGQAGVLAQGTIQIVVRDQLGAPVPNAPLYLRPEVASALLGLTADSENLAAPLRAFTNTDGIATIYVKP